MATSEALIKYYDCLKDSFNKIQDKDNKTALVNAALRPKIREEFEKSEEVLVSYLNYIQVFSLIYSDKFPIICNNIVTPLFKDNKIGAIGAKQDVKNEGSQDNKAAKVHDTIESIISSSPELADDFVHSVVKTFPNIIDGIEHQEINESFLTYLKNCFKICTYLHDEHLVTVVTKILEKINPPPIGETQESSEYTLVRKTVDASYNLIYECLDELNDLQMETIMTALVAAFTREFLSSKNEDQFNYLVLYICSLDESFPDILTKALWSTFKDTSRSLQERSASVAFASSYLSRANYIDLDKVISYLEAASNYCHEFVKDNSQEKSSNDSVECFQALAQSMFYLITQRYREMYEEETLSKLKQLKLDSIIRCSLKPLSNCDNEIGQRFQEVAALYHIAKPVNILDLPARKKRKGAKNHRFIPPFPETVSSLNERIRPLYRNYYNHRNFTIYRE